MVFSENEDNNAEILEAHFNKIEQAGVKKYVVSINNAFVPLLDEMSIEERNEVINDIISLHNDNVNEKKQTKKAIKIFAQIVIFILILLFAAPGILWLINKSFTLTQNNYAEMQTNFEVLYKNKKK